MGHLWEMVGAERAQHVAAKRGPDKVAAIVILLDPGAVDQRAGFGDEPAEVACRRIDEKHQEK